MGVEEEKAGRLAFSSLTSDRPSGPYISRGGATQADFPLEAGELRTTSSSNLSQTNATREKTACSLVKRLTRVDRHYALGGIGLLRRKPGKYGCTRIYPRTTSSKSQ